MKAVEAYKKGKYHQAEIAEQFGISIATFNRYWRAYNAHGDLSPEKIPPWSPCSFIWE
ncbi:helix-turn-helix domain-containing protein [Piscirickettsia litoralis]|uniref:helix-turn-helix domain-containing protein n=1 Tax=Piscirickettsia litoralis TaxID=1891921 RepID=UPI00373FE18D